MKKFMTGLFLAFLCACATPPTILPLPQRKMTYDIETKLDSKAAFQKVVLWSAKTFNNTNESVRLKDPETGTFVAKGNLSCDAMNICPGSGQPQRIDFILEIKTKKGLVTASVEDIVGRTLTYCWDDATRPSTQQELANAKAACIDPFIEGLKSQLK